MGAPDNTLEREQIQEQQKERADKLRSLQDQEMEIIRSQSGPVWNALKFNQSSQ